MLKSWLEELSAGGSGGRGVSWTLFESTTPNLTGAVTNLGGGTFGVMPTPAATGGPNLLALPPGAAVELLPPFSQGILPTIGAADLRVGAADCSDLMPRTPWPQDMLRDGREGLRPRSSDSDSRCFTLS